MKRRDLLRRTTAALAVGAAAGCLSEGDGSAGDGETTDEADGDTESSTDRETTADPGTRADEETDSETETSTDSTGSETPTIRDRGIGTYEAECLAAEDEERASVAFDDHRIDVEGAVTLPDPCQEPTLAAAEYDGDALVVTVGASSGDDAEMCTQCTAIAEYLIRIGFDEGVPSSVRVEHETTGETRTITTASA